MEPDDHQTALVAPLLAWLYRDELRHSRLIWRLEADARLDPAWPYEGLYFDPAGAALVDLRGHPKLGADPPWFQADATDPAALELLCAVRLPELSEVLVSTELVPVLAAVGATTSTGVLDVYVCAPDELGEAALPYQPLRLTTRHRALVAAEDWRPDDLAKEVDEAAGGVRWAILRDGRIASRLLVQRVSEHLAEVADVCTRRELRRRGYGAAVVQQVVRRLHERGLTATYSVHPSNRPSIRLAESVGFHLAFRWERIRVRRG